MAERDIWITFRNQSIGDCLFGKYFLDNVHANRPRAQCILVLPPDGAYLRPILATSPHITPFPLSGLLPRLRLLHTSFRRARVSISPRLGLRPCLLARWLARPDGLFSLRANPHMRFVTFDAARTAGNSVAEREREALAAFGLRPMLPRPKIEFMAAPELTLPFPTPRPCIVLHPFASSPTKELSADGKSRLMKAVIARFGGQADIVMTGTTGDIPRRPEAEPGSVIDAVGKLTLEQLLLLLARAAGVVAMDTGVAHLAVQLGIPTVVLYSCAAAGWWRDDIYGTAVLAHTRMDQCDPKRPGGCPRTCLEAIDPETVVSGLRPLSGEPHR